jgi:type IX secretion system PorP/SprF family membrane protein
MMKKILIIIFCFITISSYSQDPQFSQFYAAPLFLGPSFAGSSTGLRVTSNFRDQWPKLPGEFVTYAVGVDNYFADYRSGVGLFLMHDRAANGSYNVSSFALQYGFNAKISRDLFFKPGLEVSYNQRAIDFYSLHFADQMNRTFDDDVVPASIEAPPKEKFNQFDFSSSMLLYSSNYWIGGSVNHLLSLHKSIADNDYYTPLKVSFYGGYKIELNAYGLKSRMRQENIFISMYFRRQSQLSQLDFGAYYQKMPFLIGIWYRGIPAFKETLSQDALAILLGYSFDSFSLGYSYDFTISRLISVTGGSHEFSFTYVFDSHYDSRSRKKKHVATPCPYF